MRASAYHKVLRCPETTDHRRQELGRALAMDSLRSVECFVNTPNKLSRGKSSNAHRINYEHLVLLHRNSQVQRHTVELAIDPSLRSSSDMRRAEHRPSMRELPTNICVPRHVAYNKSGNKTPQMVSYPPATSKVSKMKALDAAFQVFVSFHCVSVSDEIWSDRP